MLNVVVSENPVLKADAVKYLMVFRSQVCTVRCFYAVKQFRFYRKIESFV